MIEGCTRVAGTLLSMESECETLAMFWRQYYDLPTGGLCEGWIGSAVPPFRVEVVPSI
jgi:hypothetical protein